MIWVEILSRHRDVLSRVRIDRPEISIGRGYDNDVIVDDPYVAARHLRIFRDEAGQLVAEDCGSANGLFLDGSKGKGRLTRVVVDGAQPIRIGQTLLRIRETSHAVEPERLAQAERGHLPVMLVCGLGIATLALTALKIWYTQTAEPHLTDYLTPTLTLTGTVFVWVAVWSLLSRLFSGRARFLHHLLIAEAGAFVFLLYNEIAQYVAFALAWPHAFAAAYIVTWLILAIMGFLHLREVGRTHLIAKALVVAVLFVVAVAVQAVQQSEALANSGRQTNLQILRPPGLRLAPIRDEGAFIQDIGKLKAKLDEDRAKAASTPP